MNGLQLFKAALLENQVSNLEKALKAATERKGRKRNQIQKHRTLTVAEGRKLAAKKAARQQLEDERRQDEAQLGVCRRATTRCSSCKKAGHNLRTSKKDTLDTAEH